MALYSKWFYDLVYNLNEFTNVEYFYFLKGISSKIQLGQLALREL